MMVENSSNLALSKSPLKEVRRYFHRHPELSGYEKQTAQQIIQQLDALCPHELITSLGGYGVMAVFKGKEPGPVILLRADIDALPITEINDFDHQSTLPGVSHKCGHDGHLTILLGVAHALSQNPIKQGTVLLLFQPSEENGQGANAVLNDPQFLSHQPHYVFALHNLPGYPLHEVVYRENSFSSSVRSMILKYKGKTSHAAEPEHGINPTLAVARTIQTFLTCSNNQMEREDFAVVTPIHTRIGEIAYGTSAGYGETHFTIRTWSESQMQILNETLVQHAQTIAREYNLAPEICYTDSFQATCNNREAVNVIRAAAETMRLSLTNREFPFKWGEDFGAFTQRYPGAMFGLGAGTDSPALHNPDYDFPDELLTTGINLFMTIIKQFCEG